jgi:hypothetical protein
MDEKKTRKAKMTIDVTTDIGVESNKIRAILLESDLKTTYSEMFKTAFEVAGVKAIARAITESRRDQ